MKKVVSRPTSNKKPNIFTMASNLVRLSKTIPMAELIPALDTIMLSSKLSDLEKPTFFKTLFSLSPALKRTAKLSVLFALQPHPTHPERGPINLLIRWAMDSRISPPVFQGILDHVNCTPFAFLVTGGNEFSSLMPIINKLRFQSHPTEGSRR